MRRGFDFIAAQLIVSSGLRAVDPRESLNHKARPQSVDGRGSRDSGSSLVDKAFLTACGRYTLSKATKMQSHQTSSGHRARACCINRHCRPELLQWSDLPLSGR